MALEFSIAHWTPGHNSHEKRISKKKRRSHLCPYPPFYAPVGIDACMCVPLHLLTYRGGHCVCVCVCVRSLPSLILCTHHQCTHRRRGVHTHMKQQRRHGTHAQRGHTRQKRKTGPPNGKKTAQKRRSNHRAAGSPTPPTPPCVLAAAASSD